MTAAKKKVKDIAEEVYKHGFTKIVIDFIQEDVEELLEMADATTDDMGSIEYQCGLLLEICNPVFVKDIKLLTDLKFALAEWNTQRVFINRSLGLSPEL